MHISKCIHLSSQILVVTNIAKLCCLVSSLIVVTIEYEGLLAVGLLSIRSHPHGHAQKFD